MSRRSLWGESPCRRKARAMWVFSGQVLPVGYIRRHCSSLASNYKSLFTGDSGMRSNPLATTRERNVLVCVLHPRHLQRQERGLRLGLCSEKIPNLISHSYQTMSGHVSALCLYSGVLVLVIQERKREYRYHNRKMVTIFFFGEGRKGGGGTGNGVARRSTSNRHY